jgi:hypothetical protein
MAIDMSKMRAKMEALRNKGGGGDNVFWKPKDGEQAIRIVPTPDGDPFKEYWFHYNLGKNRGFLSPYRMYGIDDPLNSFVRSLFMDKTEESRKVALDLMAKQRFFAPVIVRGEEDKGVRIWGFGKRAYEQILSLVLNPEYGDITDVDEGIDIVLKYGKGDGDRYASTTLTPRRKSSPLCPDNIGGNEKCSEWLDNIPNFEELFTKKSVEEIQVMLDEWLAGEVEGEDVVKYDNSGATVAVDAAFNELINA